jgi:hypothetical protein
MDAGEVLVVEVDVADGARLLAMVVESNGETARTNPSSGR